MRPKESHPGASLGRCYYYFLLQNGSDSWRDGGVDAALAKVRFLPVPH